MTTGAAWNIDNPLKPWARFDPNAIRALMAQSQVPRRKTVAPAAPEPTPSAPP